MAKEYVVTPWEVKGDIDYGKLIEEFGVKAIDDALLKRLERKTGKLHHLLRRKVFFAHTYLDRWLDAVEKGETVYFYTGRAPSGPVHLGHAVPWILLQWLQERLGAVIIFQVPDEEKFLFKEGLTMAEAARWTEENILDIIAMGFDPTRTRIVIDTRHADVMYKVACEVAKRTTASTAKALFGLKDADNVGKYFYTCMQSVPAFLPTLREGRPTRCLIPCAIDQDVHFRLTRDVAERIGYPKPATLLCRFLPSLDAGSKMSSSDESSFIAMTDDAKTVKRKINKYAFSGGKETVEEHRKHGGNPDVDVAYQYLTFFEEDDAKLKKIHDDYKSGKLLSGELKAILIEKLNAYLAEHQKRREAARKVVKRFIASSDEFGKGKP